MIHAAVAILEGLEAPDIDRAQAVHEGVELRTLDSFYGKKGVEAKAKALVLVLKS